MSDYGHNDAVRRWDGESWSLGVASCFGVQIRLHLTLFIVLASVALLSFGLQPQGVVVAGVLLLALAVHVLGHCLVANVVAARREEWVVWPLGELTVARLPQRTPESVIIYLAGPAANLVACLMLLPGLHLVGGLTRELWNPFHLEHLWQGAAEPISYLGFAFKANYWLLLANLLPLYPLDAGRVLREALAMHASMLQATIVATVVGAVGGLAAAAVALWWNYAWAALAAGAVAYVSFRKHREVELLGETQENEFGYDFSEGYTSLEKSMSSAHRRSHASFAARVRGWIEERRRRRGEFLEVELDRILAKIHDHGIASLSRIERKILSEASRKRRR
jgi:Zn-dependent protease